MENEERKRDRIGFRQRAVSRNDETRKFHVKRGRFSRNSKVSYETRTIQLKLESFI